MGPVQSIKTCLRKSFTLSGRASRSEFWWFAPAWSLLCLGLLITVSQIDGPAGTHVLYLTVLTLLSFPIWSVGARRMQDAGRPGRQLLFPFFPFVVTCSVVLLGALMPNTQSSSEPRILNFVFIICALSTFASGILSLNGLTKIGNTIGQLLVSSDPKTNQFGPNPNEALS